MMRLCAAQGEAMSGGGGKSNAAKLGEHASIGFYILVLSLLRAIGNYIFLIPNGFAPGGISGIATILYTIVGIYNPRLAQTAFNPALTIIIMNLPLFVIAFLKLNKRFALRTMLCVAGHSLFLGLFSLVNLPVFYSADLGSGVLLLGAIAGGAICGVGMGFMLRLNMSLGGTEIIGRLFYKKNPIADMQWLVFMADCAVVLASGLVGVLQIDSGMSTTDMMIRILSPILYSFISLFMTSKVAEIILSGLKSSLEFHIITDKADEIASAITKTMHRGVTIFSGVGYFTHSERKLLLCVVRNKQINQVKRIIKNTDPAAFVCILDARQVTGRGFERIDVD
jgi:uncharacterized membrane-anchored protein YitT (DUF2179 family)